MIVELIAGVVAGSIGGVAGGLYLGRELISKYKHQRNEAVEFSERLLDDDATGEVKQRAVAVKSGAPVPISMDQLKNLPPSNRVKIELARLHEGLPPRDTLEGLTPSAIEKIMITRMEEGWDDY